MKTIEAGARVVSGQYLSLRTWAIQPIATSGTPLSGRTGEKFIALPTLVAFALAPMFGALFIVFLPVVGMWLTAMALIRPALRLVNRIATAFAATVAPGWEPGLAHLTGKRAEVDVSAEWVEEDPLDTLEREIARRRNARRAAR